MEEGEIEDRKQFSLVHCGKTAGIRENWVELRKGKPGL